MAEKTRQEKLKEITDGIADGIKSVFTSEKFKDYLKTMSKFHKYSVNNITLIFMQRPDASRVAGFRDWSRKFGRHVKAGEKGIKIIAPTPVKKKQEKLDPDTNLPMRDRDGNIIMDEQETIIPFYKKIPHLHSVHNGSIINHLHERGDADGSAQENRIKEEDSMG